MTWPCCAHCDDDLPHVEKDSHDLPCTRCGQGQPRSIDAAFLESQREFSIRTYGPGMRTEGVSDHIRKELKEIEDDPTDLAEWVDVIILGFDGAQRLGVPVQDIIDAIHAKAAKNRARTWPDWRIAEPGKAIEHDRSAE